MSAIFASTSAYKLPALRACDEPVGLLAEVHIAAFSAFAFLSAGLGRIEPNNGLPLIAAFLGLQDRRRIVSAAV